VAERITLEQLRIFIACVEQGSFSGAGRRLRRSQSVVSQAIAHLERQIGVALFDRSARLPVVTSHGRALLADARAAAHSADGFAQRARALAEGCESELAIAVDMMLPLDWLTRAAGAFHEAFPKTRLRLHRETSGGPLQPVLDEACRIGVLGPRPDLPDSLVAQPLLEVPVVTVAAPSHPLAGHAGVIPRAVAARHLQLVLVEPRHDDPMQLPLTWCLSDLGIQHAFLRAGLGWGCMPRPHVQADLEAGLLTALQMEDQPADPPHFAMRSVFRKDAPPGIEGRWFLERLRALAV
jgi:DNA-binding transcriptional LysR family regulator